MCREISGFSLVCRGSKSLGNTEVKDINNILHFTNSLIFLHSLIYNIDILSNIFSYSGFETTSTTISFCLYELAKNPDVQKKLQEEIDEVLLTDFNTHELNYEKITSMKYLAACVRETLRKYTPIPLLFREASNDYQISGSKTVIERGTPIVIPVHAIQNDPDYYPDPDEFIPERFLDGKSNESDTFFPFGDGPRKCIGRKILFPCNYQIIFLFGFSRHADGLHEHKNWSCCYAIKIQC